MSQKWKIFALYFKPFPILILIFILFQSEGRAGEDWELSKEVMCFFPPSEGVSYLSLVFPFFCSSTTF